MRHFNSIAIFVEAVKSGSFAAAAFELDISKPTVSKQIAALEAHLGQRLLNRSTRGLTLTPAGQRFYDHCQTIMAELKEAEQELRQGGGNPHGVLRVIAPNCLAWRHLVPDLPTFISRYPELNLKLELSDAPVDLTAAEFDVAVQITDGVPAGMESQHLATCVQILCASPQYVQRNGAPRTPRELAQFPCLAWQTDPGDRWRLDGPQGHEIAHLDCKVRTDSLDALRALLIAGCGVGLIPGALVTDDIVAGRLARVLPDYESTGLELRAVFPKNVATSGRVQAFVDFIRPRLAAMDLGS